MPEITGTRPAPGAPIESTWGGEVHDAIESIQFGSQTVSGITDSTDGTAIVTFPRAYASPPSIWVSGGSTVVICGAQAITATNFKLAARRADGSASAYSGTFFWMAIGELA